MTDALVIGGGPAGLMAATMLLAGGRTVTLAEAKPSIGRKFLMAGKSGLNLTKMEPTEAFHAAYIGDMHPTLRTCLNDFGPQEVKQWAEALGQTTFTGSTGRLFPTVMKASPLLRSWLGQLEAQGLVRHTRWRWEGWDKNAFTFATPEGHRTLTPRVTVLALGGASWARLGSDGAWAGLFAANGIRLAPFQPSNSGLNVAWSSHIAKHFGAPLKNIALTAGDAVSRGEIVISERGLEGGGLYPLTAKLRDGATLQIDLRPDLSVNEVAERFAKPRGKQSVSSHLRKSLKLTPAAQALLREFASPLPSEPADLARAVKAVPIRHAGLRPLDEAISTAGGVPFDVLDDHLMLRDKPGVFCAGEMLDWDAPTGGYLLTACFATGRWAGLNAAEYARP